jgi:hypothetical protein
VAEHEQISYRIIDDDEQVRLEQARLLTLARVADPFTRERLLATGLAILSPISITVCGRRPA